MNSSLFTSMVLVLVLSLSALVDMGVVAQGDCMAYAGLGGIFGCSSEYEILASAFAGCTLGSGGDCSYTASCSPGGVTVNLYSGAGCAGSVIGGTIGVGTCVSAFNIGTCSNAPVANIQAGLSAGEMVKCCPNFDFAAYNATVLLQQKGH